MRCRDVIRSACVLVSSTMLWGQFSYAQTVADLSDIHYNSEVIHTFTEDKNFRLHRIAPGAIATWADFHEGVEVFISSVGTVEYGGYWIEGLETPSTRAFVVPMGGISSYVTGKDIKGTFTYWSPYTDEQNKDFSDHLQFSPNGAHSYYEMYRDGAQFGIVGQRSFEIAHNFIAPVVRNDGSIAYIERVREEIIAVFVDGKRVSPEFEVDSIKGVINTVSDDGSGYMYGIVHESGGWFLKNGEPVAVDVGAPIQSESMSADGTKHAYVYEVNGLLRVVINEKTVGPPHVSVSPIVFSRDSQHWHYFSPPATDGSSQGALVTSDGQIPNLTDVRQAMGYIVGDARPTFLAKQDGANYLFSGKDRFGPYDDPRGLKFALNQEHFSHFLLDYRQAVIDIIVDGRAQGITMVGEYLNHRVSDNGEVYHYEKIDDEEVAFRNGREIVRFSDITNFGLTQKSARLFIVGVDEGSDRSTLWVEGAGEVFSAEEISILDTGEFDLVATWARDDGKTFLTLDEAIVGGFDEILYENSYVADFTDAGVAFFARNGRDILQISVPLSLAGTKKTAGTEREIPLSGRKQNPQEVSDNDPPDLDLESQAIQSTDKETERLLRQRLAEREEEIGVLKRVASKAEIKASLAAVRELNAMKQLALANDLLELKNDLRNAMTKATESSREKQVELMEEVEKLLSKVERMNTLVELRGRAIETHHKLIDISSPAVVQYVQNRLIELGYDPGEPDGKIGGKTRDAIADYVSDLALPLSGLVTPELVTYLAVGSMFQSNIEGTSNAAPEISDEKDMQSRAQSIAPLRAAMRRIEIQPQDIALFIDVFEKSKAHLEWDFSEYRTINDMEVYYCFSDWHSPEDRPLKNAFRDFVGEYKISQRLFRKFNLPAGVWRKELDRVMEEAIVVTYPLLQDYGVGELHVEDNWHYQAAVGRQVLPHLKEIANAIGSYIADTNRSVSELKTVVRCI